MAEKQHEESFEDECGWCGHKLKVYVRSWETCKSHYSIPILANYCNEKTRQEKGEYNCEEEALSTPENEKKVLLEMWRRRKKLARIAAEEAEQETEAEPVTQSD